VNTSATSLFDPKRARWQGMVFALMVYCAAWAMLRLQSRGVITPQPNWPILADFFLTVPLSYLWLNRRAGKQAWLGALALCGAGLLMARQIMPDEPLLMTLGTLRYGAIGVGLGLELVTVISLLALVRRLGHAANAEVALHDALAQRLGANPAMCFVQFEARMWLYCLAPLRWPWRFSGDRHYTYHGKDSNASTHLGFIYLVLLGLPVDHLLLHLWSPTVAWVATLVTLYGVVFQIAHYKAIRLRPISLDAQRLWLRNGLLGDVELPLSVIDSVEANRGHVGRASGRLRFGADPSPNLCLRLRQPRAIATCLGREILVHTLYFSVDEPQRMLADLRAKLGAA